MNKSIVLKIISIVSAFVAVVAIACAITVTGDGFLDLSNIVRTISIVAALIFAILAAAAWKASAKH